VIEPLSSAELVLETERLRLTPLTEDDLDIATALLCDPEAMRYVDGAITPDEAEEHMSDAVKRGAGGRIGIWCVRRKDTGQKIGDGVLLPIPIDQPDTDWSLVVLEAYPSGNIEVGYLLIPEAWGQGFATEICTRLLRFVFEMTDLKQIVAVTDPGNFASQHVLRKCGLRDVGHGHAYGTDVRWFEMTRKEWGAQAPHQLPSGSPG
jgi:ribosomal-protein-alanine N-acetyltransferase